MILIALAAMLNRPAQKAGTPPDKPKLVVTDIKKGEGEAVAFGDQVTVDYTGTLTDGKEFDSSKKPGRTPFSFVIGLGSVIKGWDQGVMGMRVGGVRKLKIPSDLAYGDAGAPPTIPAKSTLLFTIELHKIDHPLKRIKIEITQAGKGPGIKLGQTAHFGYDVRLPDGTYLVPKENLTTNNPLVIGSAGRTVPALLLGLLGTKAGESRTITIPSDLAPMRNVPPNSSVIVDVKMISIDDTLDQSGGREKRQ